MKDGIPKAAFTVQCVLINAFIDSIMTLGRGTLMAKFDVVTAYRNVAIHPEDRPVRDEVAETIFCGCVAPIETSFRPLYFYGHCRSG